MIKIAVDIEDWDDIADIRDSFLPCKIRDIFRYFCQDFRGSVDDFMNYVLGYYGKKDCVDASDIAALFEDRAKLAEMAAFFKKEGLLNEYF